MTVENPFSLRLGRGGSAPAEFVRYSIMDVAIDSIAFQTNILALNAAAGALHGRAQRLVDAVEVFELAS